MVSTVCEHYEFLLTFVQYSHRVLSDSDLQNRANEGTRETFAISRAGNPHRGDSGGGYCSVRHCVVTVLCYVTNNDYGLWLTLLYTLTAIATSVTRLGKSCYLTLVRKCTAWLNLIQERLR